MLPVIFLCADAIAAARGNCTQLQHAPKKILPFCRLIKREITGSRTMGGIIHLGFEAHLYES